MNEPSFVGFCKILHICITTKLYDSSPSSCVIVNLSFLFIMASIRKILTLSEVVIVFNEKHC